MGALNDISSEMEIILPIHPRTRKIMETRGLKTQCTMIDPVGYFDMIQLLEHTRIVLTDSGGLQKEAFFFGKPCVTLRDETEWTELVAGGYNILVGADKNKICGGFNLMRTTVRDYQVDLYGNGKASYSIVASLLRS